MDVYQQITDRIIEAIEQNPSQFQMPWQRFGGQIPENGTTNAEYRGVNILNLWCEAQLRGFNSNRWASYKQWREGGCQVRKGEKSSLIVFYKAYSVDVDGQEETRRVLRWSFVFNSDQVDGYQAPDLPSLPPLERLAAVDRFIAGTGATVIEGGQRAFYRPADDTIHMPDGDRFIDTKTSSRTENFYSTLCHELTHWSGAKHRLDRLSSTRFGDPKYAFEELVAELGAAFLCARLNVTAEVREDHSQYIANWLNALKNDKKFIFSAAAKAQEACEFLMKGGDHAIEQGSATRAA